MVPLQVTFLMLLGRLTGTWYAKPLRNFCPPTVGRTLVIQVPLNVVVAGEQLGQ
jgi:hypothetical protein